MLSKTRHEYESIYEILEKAKPINNDRNYISCYLGPGIDHKRGTKKTSRVL